MRNCAFAYLLTCIFAYLHTCIHLPYTTRLLSGTFKKPSRELPNTFQSTSRHLSDTLRTPSGHPPNILQIPSTHLVHVSFVNLVCIPNFSFLGYIEVRYPSYTPGGWRVGGPTYIIMPLCGPTYKLRLASWNSTKYEFKVGQSVAILFILQA